MSAPGRKRGGGPKAANACPDCGHHRRGHHEGICGDSECDAWKTYPDARCPSIAWREAAVQPRERS